MNCFYEMEATGLEPASHGFMDLQRIELCITDMTNLQGPNSGMFPLTPRPRGYHLNNQSDLLFLKILESER